MSKEIKQLLSWTFMTECAIPNDVTDLLVPGERAIRAFKTVRDSAIFTDKRIIVRDVQGITGKKVEIYSLPFTSILMWSSENAGKIFDLNSELELWTKVGNLKIKLGSKINIREFDKLLATCLLK